MTPNSAAGFDPAALRAARLEAGMSSEDLASQVGGDRTTVYRWETGRRRPQITTVVAMAEVLGVPVARLMGEPSTLAELRTHAGLSQVQAAEVIAVSRPRYTAIETGKARPSHEQAAALAAAFSVDVETLEGVLTQE